MNAGSYRIFSIFLLGCVLRAQPPAPAVPDPMGRNTPQESVLHFLEACHARDYHRALRYLDLRSMTPEQRARQGPPLAQQLDDLIDSTPFDITTLSSERAGDQDDGLPITRERLLQFRTDGQKLEIQLERVELRPGLRVWVVSADSVALIPRAHQLLTETAFEKKLPAPLVTFTIFDTPVWRWIVLLGIGAALWVIARWISAALVAVIRPLWDAPELRNPLRACLVVVGTRAAMALAPPAALARLYLVRALGLAFFLSLAWAGAAVIDLIARRWHSRLDPRVQAVSYSVLPLGRQVLKLVLFLIAILGVLSAWGYNTSTILAGLGVGGLAVALAAQKTIENLFGGISVIGDRPVLVGDLCRFGDRLGTVVHIGLRSTQIRTYERTIISVPNSQFSSVPLENISRRDKIWFHTTLNLRQDATSLQLLRALDSIRQVLVTDPRVDPGKLPVRFVGVGQYSLDLEVFAYVLTSDQEEFLAIQQELLLKILQAVEEAGTALAVPVQESLARPAHA